MGKSLDDSAELPAEDQPISGEDNDNVEPFEMEQLPKFLLQLSKDDAGVVISALSCLYTIFSLVPNNKDLAEAASSAIRKEAVGLGFVGMLIITLRKWKSTPTIQASAMSCLGFLAADEAVSIAKLGGVDLIVAACKHHANRLDVQEAGVYALAKIMIPNPGTLTKGTVTVLEKCVQRFVEQLKGLDVIVEATKEFPDSKNLQAGACTLFGKIGTDKKYHKALLESGAINVAAIAAKGQSGEDKLKENGRIFLSKMPVCMKSECWA